MYHTGHTGGIIDSSLVSVYFHLHPDKSIGEIKQRLS